jgi:hypothetical protein
MMQTLFDEAPQPNKWRTLLRNLVEHYDTGEALSGDDRLLRRAAIYFTDGSEEDCREFCIRLAERSNRMIANQQFKERSADCSQFVRLIFQTAREEGPALR